MTEYLNGKIFFTATLYVVYTNSVCNRPNPFRPPHPSLLLLSHQLHLLSSHRLLQLHPRLLL